MVLPAYSAAIQFTSLPPPAGSTPEQQAQQKKGHGSTADLVVGTVAWLASWPAVGLVACGMCEGEYIEEVGRMMGCFGDVT